MKATQACKIVGYALEDTNKEGTIQVFAHLTEYAAPAVATLRARTEELNRMVEALTKDKAKQQGRKALCVNVTETPTAR